MKIEKKLVLCSILAISIGVATIIPLQYIMNAEAATPNAEPWFDVGISYAEFNPYIVSNETATWNGAPIQAVANFTPTTGALKNADAQVEYYKFAVASEQGPIGTMGYYIIGGTPIRIELNGNGTINFDGLTLNPPESDDGQAIIWSGQGVGWTGDKPRNSAYGALYMDISAYTATQLRNAQTLSIDVSKVCTVTVKGNTVITTPADPTILQHIELTKTDNGFVYGTYIEGTLPYNFTRTLP